MAIIPRCLRKRFTSGALLLIAAAMCSHSSTAGTPDRHSLTEISDRVTNVLLDHYLASDRYADVEVNTQAPDARLRLAKCSEPLIISLPHNPSGGRVTSQVACRANDTQWSIYVISQVKLLAQVVVARTPLLRGQAIRADDVQMAVADVTRLSQGFYSAAEDVIGMEPRRSINPGDQLRVQWLVAPKAVKRGERVTLVAKSSAVAVETVGTALSDGRMGEQIRVRNERSDRIVKGTVSGDKLVSINL